MAELRYVELAGTPAAMGQAFGEQFRDQIQQFTAARMDHLAAFVARYDPARTISAELMLDRAGRMIAAHEQFDAAIWTEFCSIARASRLTVEQLLIANALTDLRDYVLFEQQRPSDRAAPVEVDECSALLVPASCTGGHTLAGKTWDMHADAIDHLVVVRRSPLDGPGTLGLTTVGCLCLIGINDRHVAVGNTNLVPTDVRLGVSYLFTITRALGCASASEAADAIVATPRMSGHNFYAADAQTGVNVECTAGQAQVSPVASEPFVHTNHYLVPSLKALEFERCTMNSQWRYEQLQSRVNLMRRPVTVQACWDELGRVCQACVPTDPQPAAAIGGPLDTVATVIMCPAQGTLYLCAGGAGAAEPQRFTL